LHKILFKISDNIINLNFPPSIVKEKNLGERVIGFGANSQIGKYLIKQDLFLKFYFRK